MAHNHQPLVQTGKKKASLPEMRVLQGIGERAVFLSPFIHGRRET